MDADRCSICGEESFGTGQKPTYFALFLSFGTGQKPIESRHCLITIAMGRRERPCPGERRDLGGPGLAQYPGAQEFSQGARGNHPPRQIPIPIPTFALVLVQDSLVSVKEVVEAHWLTYGRNYYTRYDYEGLEKAKGDAVMSHLRSNVIPSAAGQSFGPGMTIEKAEEFAYTDPIDGSVSTQQVRRRDPPH